MFKTPEGEQLYNFTIARPAAEMVRLFLNPSDKEILRVGLDAWKAKIVELRSEAIRGGWVANDDDETACSIEDAASAYIDQNFPEYQKVSEKQMNLFRSALDIPQRTDDSVPATQQQ
jgi:hypothetical protein